jgi:regulator of protease activity HflC (stomatin/prohibitin superfamily)
MNLRPLRFFAPLVLVLGTSGCAFQRIPVASVGVKFNAYSGMSTKILRPEVVFVNPFTERLIIYPTGITNASFVARADEGDRHGDDSIKASTVEGAVLPIDVTVAYRIPADAESVMKIFNSFGVQPLREIQREHIRWATVIAVNEVSGKKAIFDLISRERATLGPEVKTVLAGLLEKWGFVVEDVLIREIHPPDAITAKIQEQQGHRSDLEKARTEQKQAKIEAETLLTNAQKEAEQNRLLSTQGQVAIELKRLELRRKAIDRWDGRAPLIGPSGVPFADAGF